MIQTRFIKIFSIRVYHTFFDDNNCNCLQFVGDSVTEKILQKNGFIMRVASSGFDVFYNSDAPLTSILDHISTTTSQDYFEFNIKSNNPNFILFTALPVNFLGQITYSSQNNKNTDHNGNVELNETLDPQENNSFLGSLKIYFEDLKKFLHNSDSVIYEINFKARETQWQYYIINKGSIPLNNPAITKKGDIQFEGPEEVTIETGEKALLFSSNNRSFSLSEKPKYKFDLVDINNESSTLIIKNLPMPAVFNMKIIKNSKGNQAVSSVYIYL